MTYFNWLIYFGLVPNLILWGWQFHYFKKYLKVFVKITAASVTAALIWDALAIHVYRIWSFPRDNIWGWYLFDIPIEQYLFYILTSWLVVELTLVLRKYGY